MTDSKPLTKASEVFVSLMVQNKKKKNKIPSLRPLSTLFDLSEFMATVRNPPRGTYTSNESEPEVKDSFLALSLLRDPGSNPLSSGPNKFLTVEP